MRKDMLGLPRRKKEAKVWSMSWKNKLLSYKLRSQGGRSSVSWHINDCAATVELSCQIWNTSVKLSWNLSFLWLCFCFFWRFEWQSLHLLTQLGRLRCLKRSWSSGLESTHGEFTNLSTSSSFSLFWQFEKLQIHLSCMGIIEAKWWHKATFLKHQIFKLQT